MSLVGTRPILPDELEQYELHHRARIAIKPGITGMWQVSGRSDITDFEGSLLDELYSNAYIYTIPKSFLRNINDFELIDGVAEAIKKINTSGYLAIVVTNQPVIARGEVTFQELEEIHNKMETELGLQGAYLDAIYYCPHHPHKGYEGEVPELKIECDCRKPKPGMLLKAAGDYNIDLSQSYMIGDGENDIKAGLAAGCKAVLVNGDGTDAKNEDFGQIDTLASVLEFVDKYFH